MANESQRVIVITGASRGLGVCSPPRHSRLSSANRRKLEWVKQLSKDPNNFIIAVVRNPENVELLNPFLGPAAITIKGDITDIDSFPVHYLY